MNKKMILAVFAIAVVACATAAAFAVTTAQWNDYILPLTATIGSLGSSSSDLKITSDSGALMPVTGHSFGAVTPGQTYEWTVYIYNSGQVGQFITYTPTTGGSGQTAWSIAVTVLEYGVPNEMPLPNLSFNYTNTINVNGANPLPYALPEKIASMPVNGFYLMPTKMIKIDIALTVTLQDGTPISIPNFEIAAAYVPSIIVPALGILPVQ